MDDSSRHLHAVIIAGGRGTRFWPRSVRRRPKQLLRIAGEHTMIQETRARLEPWIDADRVWVVTGELEAPELARQLPDVPAEHILVEPRGRNTAPCIALAAEHVHARDPDAVMAVLPADHVIGKPEDFRRSLAAAAVAARDHRVLVTLGIQPSGPETGYGYIERGAETVQVEGTPFHRVDAFREKPERDAAAEMVASGRFLWNAGIFVWRADVIRDELRTHMPALARAMAPVGAALPGGDWRRAMATAYDAIDATSIDYGVLERSDKVWVVPCDFGWNDVGSWAALWEVLEHDGDGNACAGESLLIDSHRTLVVSDDRLVAAIGVDDLAIIVSEDAVLVCPRERAQDVRRAVEELERRGRDDLL